MDRSFHNTTNVCGEQLDLYEKVAVNQETKILRFLRNNPKKFYSSVEINRYVFEGQLPPQSLSRALANLKNRKKIRKTEAPIFEGLYRKPIHGWRYNEEVM